MSETTLPPKFETLVQESDKPVLVDFYADWCGPCKQVSPVVARLASEFKDRIVTVKINTDRRPELASKWQITGIPTIVLVHRGQTLMRLSGAYPYPQLRAELEKGLVKAVR
jgi:thioredoxin